MRGGQHEMVKSEDRRAEFVWRLQVHIPSKQNLHVLNLREIDAQVIFHRPIFKCPDLVISVQTLFVLKLHSTAHLDVSYTLQFRLHVYDYSNWSIACNIIIYMYIM